MGTTSGELVQILKTAIEVEENGYSTFKKYAEQTQNENGKRMFNKLAKDEMEHRAILEKQLQEYNESGEWKNIQIPKSQVEQLIPAIREKQKRTKGEAHVGEVDALNTALDLERKAAQFFRDKAEEVSDTNAKEMFIRLAEWEDSHYELIRAELDYINNTGVWFGIPEFKMDGTY